MCVVEAAVVMEGLVQCPVQTCLVLRSCLGIYPGPGSILQHSPVMFST